MSLALVHTDSAILDLLPQRSEVVLVEPHGKSNWASTARVDVNLADGSPKSYFLKTLKTHDAAARVEAEFASIHEIYNTLPSIALKLHGHRKFKDAQDSAHFFLSVYLPISPASNQAHTPTLPNPVLLGRKLATLHRTSVFRTGQFGFHCPTYDGKLPLPTTWNPSWPSFLTHLLTSVYAQDTATNGPSPQTTQPHDQDHLNYHPPPPQPF